MAGLGRLSGTLLADCFTDRPADYPREAGPGSPRRARLPALLAVAFCGLSFCGLLAGAASAAAQPPPAEAATGPVAIRSQQLMTPRQLAGSGLDPEVEVRIEIDATGVVIQVDVLAIEPPSEFDDLLRDLVRRGVSNWRYGPARDSDGNAVPATLSWRMKFKSPRPGNEAADPWGFVDPAARLDPQLDVLVSAGGLPQPVKPLSLQQRARRLTRFVEIAEKYVDRDHRRRRETPRFIVVSDAEEESTVDTLAGNMEGVFQTFHAIFDSHLEPMPNNSKIVVYLYRSKDNLTQLQKEMGGRLPGGGFYRSPGFLAFHQEVRFFDQLLHTMIHEAFHAYSDSHLTAPGRSLPRWAEEGLAEYFGNSEVDKGQLVPGRTSRGMYAIVHGRSGPRRLMSESQWNLGEARSALRKREAPTISDLLEATEDTFYGERYRHYYGFSWLLTHFLQHGREAWSTRQPFGTLLLYLAEGYSGRDALAAVYETTPEELQREFERYVRRL